MPHALFLSVAIARTFGTAISGESKERRELADDPFCICLCVISRFFREWRINSWWPKMGSPARCIEGPRKAFVVSPHGQRVRHCEQIRTGNDNPWQRVR